MKKSHLAAVAASLLLAVALTRPAVAQTTGQPADHEALRVLKNEAVRVVNERDYATARRILAEPFDATILTQDAFSDFEKLKAHFEGLYTRDRLKMKKIEMSAEADDYARIYEGRFAVAKGATKERYELADGRAFDLQGRWTAVAREENGAWKIVALHTGTNFLDNPVLTAIAESMPWFAGIGGLAGLVVGLFGGFFIGRGRRPKTA